MPTWSRKFLAALLPFALALVIQAPVAAAQSPAKPTILLVHGAFAESLSWENVIPLLLEKGYPVVAAPNPLRGVRSDAAYVASIIDSIQGDVVLVGHSYGGTVITNAAAGQPRVKALVYVSAFAPESGESAADLYARYPNSLGASFAAPVAVPGGGKDLYLQQSRYHQQLAADLPERIAVLLAATQRPIAEAALSEPSGTPAWKDLPSWFIYGTDDLAIAPPLLAYMAQRAGSRRTVAVDGASHLMLASRPAPVAELIDEAASRF